MRTEATNEPFDEHLEHGCGDERVEQTDDSVVDVPERSNPDLHYQNDEDGD